MDIYRHSRFGGSKGCEDNQWETDGALFHREKDHSVSKQKENMLSLA